MGLDMYLSAEKFISGYDHDKDENFEKILNLLNLDRDDAEKSATVNITVGYWRKANAIHNWFVNNVQDGRDECQRAYVSEENLRDLKSSCLKELNAINNNGFENKRELLPPTKGFFFGSTDVDERYKKDLEHTVQLIDKCLSDKFKGYTFYYQSSW